MTQENRRLTAQVKADRRLREQHASLLAKSKAAREQAAAQAARATTLEEELAQLNAKVRNCPCTAGALKRSTREQPASFHCTTAMIDGGRLLLPSHVEY